MKTNLDQKRDESSNATPLQIEKAKVLALRRQLSRSHDEKRQLQTLLSKTQTDLENQMQQYMQLRKSQAKKALALVPATREATCATKQQLKNKLASTQKELADEICKSQHFQEQCDSYKEQIYTIKQKLREHEEVENEKGRMKKYVSNLERVRSELLVVVKRQMKLVGILKKQRANIQAAELLNITERDFMREVNYK